MSDKKHVELNVHSCGAYCETVLTPDDIVAFAIQNGSKAVAITDLNSVHSMFGFARAVEKACSKIKAIYGVRLNCKKEDEPEFLITLLAKSKRGLKNVFRIMSSGYNQVLNEKIWPCVRWDNALENKEDILIGRECSWSFIKNSQGKNTVALENEINFTFDGVDYVEITPFNQSPFSLELNDSVDKESIQKQAYIIVNLLQKMGKTPVAVSNASCITQEDELCWNILHQNNPAEHPTFMKSTEEMLEEYAFLQDLAEKIVVDNSNYIADMIESFDSRPVRFHPISLPDAENEVKRRCKQAAEDKYGSELPEIIKDRIEDEFKKIDYSDSWSRYLLAAKISDKCNELGYMHTVRLTAGSSFIVYLLGISETNPLPPHYYCPNCKAVEFVNETEWASGFDLTIDPSGRRICSNCGAPLKGDGHNIPCEMFQGFDGAKLPAFNFNFPEEIQKDMYEYLGELFGKSNIIRAGTVRSIRYGVAAKLIKQYCEKTGKAIDASLNEHIFERMASVCENVEPDPLGYLMVLQGEDIYSFTPTGYKDIIDFNLNHNEKPIALTYVYPYLDEIGFLSFTSLSDLKLMEEFTGIKAQTIDYSDIDSLNFEITNYKEFSFDTKFIGKLMEAMFPYKFSDLMKIYGLAYGTGTWSDNAENLIADQLLDDLIAFRDDVMQCLMKHGIDRINAFSVCEYVRRGKAYNKGFTDEQLSLMRDNNIPEWLIESMQKIEYLFPKAHAVEYLICQLRKVWYKVYYPLAFYSAVLTNDVAPFFDYNILTEGKSRVELEYKWFIEKWGPDFDFSARIDTGWAESEKHVLELALECYNNGISFLPADINLSDDKRFLPENGNIRIPYNTPIIIHPDLVQKINSERSKKSFESVSDFNDRIKPDDNTSKEIKKKHLLRSLEKCKNNRMMQIGNLVDKVLSEHFFIKDENDSDKNFVNCSFSDVVTKSGFKSLDELKYGFSKDNLYLIGGRPGMGKTSLMLDMAINIAKEEKPIYIFSLDMPAEKLIIRLLSKYAKIPLTECLRGDSKCCSILQKAKKELAELPIFICDNAVTVNEIKNVVHNENVSGIVFIDYLQLIDVGAGQYGNSNNVTCMNPVLERQFEIVDELKATAQKAKLPIVLLTQLARQLEQRADKRPILKDVRYCKYVEQVADAILFIYRDAYYNGDEGKTSHTAELILAKNNGGKIGTATVEYDAETYSFAE